MDKQTSVKSLVVVAHPDDAEFGCSATIAKWNRLGMQSAYVICTDGSKGTDERSMTAPQLSALRKREQSEVGEVLGLSEVAFLDYPDGMLEPSLDLRRDITRIIRRIKPEILITMNPTRTLDFPNYLGHPDHYAAGEAALSAVYPSARDFLTFPELLDEGLEPWKVSEVWVMQYGISANFFNPLEEVDVETSIKALLTHKSQIPDPDRAKEFMFERRRELGEKISAPFAEGFKRVVLR